MLRRKPGKQHINEKMSRNKLRKLSSEEAVVKGDYGNIIRCLPYAGVKKSALN